MLLPPDTPVICAVALTSGSQRWWTIHVITTLVRALLPSTPVGDLGCAGDRTRS
jgi:hypothetical protein